VISSANQEKYFLCETCNIAISLLLIALNQFYWGGNEEENSTAIERAAVSGAFKAVFTGAA
jgi:hypothetical protein